MGPYGNTWPGTLPTCEYCAPRQQQYSIQDPIRPWGVYNDRSVHTIKHWKHCETTRSTSPLYKSATAHEAQHEITQTHRYHYKITITKKTTILHIKDCRLVLFCIVADAVASARPSLYKADHKGFITCVTTVNTVRSKWENTPHIAIYFC